MMPRNNWKIRTPTSVWNEAVCLTALHKTCQDTSTVDQNLNPGPPEYKAHHTAHHLVRHNYLKIVPKWGRYHWDRDWSKKEHPLWQCCHMVLNCRETTRAQRGNANTCWRVGICFLRLAAPCVARVADTAQRLLPPVPAMRTVVVCARSLLP
jgi:hypothetical protein